MSPDNLEEVVQSTDNLPETFRNIDLGWQPYVFREEYTNWIEEQRAVRESVAIVDQSHHMEILKIQGSDAIDLLSELGTNNFDRVRNMNPPLAVDYLVCNPDGYVIGDNLLFYVGEGKFTIVGTETINNWIRYHAEKTDRDVHAHVPYHPFDDHNPPEFRFQIQGPESLTVMEEVVDHSLPDVSFFEMDTVKIYGDDIFAVGHGMAAMPGLEIFGPYEYHDALLDDILETGEDYGIRQMGAKCYKTGKIGSGWIPFTVPAIYEHENMQDYRKWLGADSLEANLSMGGSFDSNDITDYYMTPMERGQTHLIDFDHDFVGKEALEEMVDHQQRDIVTLVWDQDDVVDVYASLFDEGDSYKYIDMPDVPTRWSAFHYDKIIDDGKVIGVSKYPGYLYYERDMLSLATIDIEYSDPGTEVKFVWGDDSDKRGVERHSFKEIRATVAPAPYVQGGKRNM